MSEEREEYKVEIDKNSNLRPDEASKIIGQKLIKIEASEFQLTLIFDNGAELNISGASYEGSALAVWIRK